MWQVGLGLVLFVATAAAMNCFQPADKAVTRKSAGHDFLAFYTAGTFVRTGRSAELYDLPAIRAFERDLVRREGLELPGDDFGPFWNPPLFAWVFAPISALPYHAAWMAWMGINLASFAGAMAILARIIAPAANWKSWALLPLLTAVSMPFIQALGHGQNACLSLLILGATVTLWRTDRAIAAGAVAGLLFYKPQLGAVITAALVLSLGWRAMIGLAITGTAMLAATVISLPGTLSAFLHRLPQNVAYMQIEHHYLWERHVTLKAFWRLLVQGYEIGDLTPLTRTIYVLSIVAAGAFLLATIWKLRPDATARDRLIAVTIVSMPLLMPFYFDYDLLLLSAAAALVAREHLASGGRIDKVLVAGWAILYAWPIFNPAMASATHVNGTVIALSFVAGTMMWRGLRRRDASARIVDEPVTLRAAA